jgi:preprotein translocase subunit SecD
MKFRTIFAGAVILLIFPGFMTAEETGKNAVFGFFGTTGDPPKADFTCDSGLGPQHLKGAEIQRFRNIKPDGTEEARYGILFSLNATGANLNRAFTEKWKKKQIAIVISGKVVSMPLVYEPSDESMVITAEYSKEEAEKVVEFLNTVKDGPR